MRRRKIVRFSIVSAAAALFGASVMPQAALATYNNWAYLPYSLGNSLLWPVRNLLYLPYQITNPYLYTNAGATVLYRATNRGQMFRVPYQNPYAQYSDLQPTVDQPGIDPNDITPPIDPNTGRRVWLPPPLAPQRPPFTSGTPSSPPVVAPSSTPPFPAGNPVASGAPNAVAAAPANAYLPPPASTAGAASASGRATMPPASPLAAGFVNRVLNVHKGDISKALFDPETRGWAKVVGLIQDNDSIFTADLSEQRVEIVRGILNDKNLDPLSKLDAVKILLRNTPAVSQR